MLKRLARGEVEETEGTAAAVETVAAGVVRNLEGREAEETAGEGMEAESTVVVVAA